MVTFITRHPCPGDVLLLIEVSDTTVSFDRTEKCPIYARAGIPEVWLVNLPDRCVERCTDPRGSRYDTIRVMRSGQHLTPAALSHLSLPVHEVLAR